MRDDQVSSQRGMNNPGPGGSSPMAQVPFAQGHVCPTCQRLLPLRLAHCPDDGTPLTANVKQAAPTPSPGAAVPAADPAIAPSGAEQFVPAVQAFWERHKVLSIFTLGTVLFWGLVYAGYLQGFVLLAMVLTVALAASWPVALTSSPKALGIVGKVDGWYGNLAGFAASGQGRFARWFASPILWCGNRWTDFSNRRVDHHVAASLRLFGYVLTVLTLALLTALMAYIAVMIVIGLLVIGVSLWLLGMLLGDDSDVGSRGFGDSIPLVGGRRTKLSRGDGGWFSTDKQAGYVDEDGNIYEDDGGLFTVAKRVGRVDEKGRIFEGNGGFLDIDRQVGTIGSDGRINDDDGGIFTVGKQVGRVGRDGRVFQGGGGIFDSEKQVGKIDPQD